MNNREELTTQTSTKSKTRIATGIVFAILVAIGIGTAIWYFGVARLGTGTIEFSEAFDDANDLVLGNEGKLVGLTEETTIVDANGNFQNVTEEYNNIELASNENSFSKDLNTESTNYLCSTSLANKIDTIEITPNPQKVTIVDNSVQSSWLRFGIDRLRNAIQISINGKPINPDTGDFDGSSIGDDFVNYNSITWSDLLRWKSSQPKVLLMTANGSIIPVFKGKSTISAGICGIPSNSLEITVDSDLTSDEAVFNNITNAGLGTAKPFFEEKLTNKLILSKELSETHAGANEINISGKSIKGIEGKLWLDRMYYPLAEYRDSIKASDLKLFFSFDKGATWRKVDLIRDINYNFVYNFNQDIFQQTASGLKYALGYEFNANTGNLNGVEYNKPLENIVSFKGSEDVNFFTIPQSNTLDFKQAQKEDTKTNFAENLIKLETIEVACSSGGYDTKCYQGAKTKALNPGISNIQIITPDDPDSVPANTSVSKEMVTLPTSLYLDRLDFSVKTGELGDEPLPPDGNTNDPACNDNFVCPEGQIRQGCTQDCIGADSSSCAEGEVMINDKCESVLEKGNDANLMVNPKIIYKGADRAIIAWTVSNDEYKNKELSFKYGTFDAKNLKKDENDKIVLEDENNATVRYAEAQNYYYVVLRNLKGGEFADKNDAGYINGRKPYVFQVSLGEKFANPTTIKTLNRFQAILYYYNLVLSENFDVNRYEQLDKNIRSGGPAFYYKPGEQEPLSLKGVQFTLLNDRKFKEFDNRINATAKKFGNKKTVQELYGRVHDRIYDEDLTKKFDDAGVNYWTKQIERNDDNRIDILGTKFALSVSPEAVGEITTMSAEDQKKANSDLAYEIVLKRGGDQKGVLELKKLQNPKEMRKKLANSKEFDDRLKSIKGRVEQIKELYETLYARAADIAGVNYWDKTGKSIQEIKQEFLNSADFSNVAL